MGARGSFGPLIFPLAVVLVLAACGGGGGGGTPTDPGPTVSFTPSSTATGESIVTQAGGGTGASTLVLQVRAHEVAGLYGVAFDLRYPSHLLSVAATAEGDFLGRNPGGEGTIPTSFQVAEIEPGTLVVGLSRLGDVGGKSGSGVLAEVTFTTLSGGSGAISFAENTAFNANGNELGGLGWIGGTVTASR